MAPPIILAAFGSSTAALDHYQEFCQTVQNTFPDNPVYQTITSRTVASRASAPYPHPAELLNRLAEEGISRAVVQSLHLLPAHDFHSFVKTIRESPVDTAIGAPLLSSEKDFSLTAEAILSFNRPDPATAVLVLGHGTSHPCWAMYASFEKKIKQVLGRQGFFAVIEKSPDSTHIPGLIKESGFQEVVIVPFFFLLGLHFQRDIMGDNPASWKNRLQRQGLTVSAVERGVGELESIRQIFIRHICDSLTRL